LGRPPFFVMQCCGFAVLPSNNLTGALQHGITAALCLTGYLSCLSPLGYRLEERSCLR